MGEPSHGVSGFSHVETSTPSEAVAAEMYGSEDMTFHRDCLIWAGHPYTHEHAAAAGWVIRVIVVSFPPLDNGQDDSPAEDTAFRHAEQQTADLMHPERKRGVFERIHLPIGATLNATGSIDCGIVITGRDWHLCDRWHRGGARSRGRLHAVRRVPRMARTRSEPNFYGARHPPRRSSAGGRRRCLYSRGCK